MHLFKFKGDWETTIQLDAFKGFQARQGAYNGLSSSDNDGILNLRIEEEFNDETDPHPAQIAAINYLLANQHAIAQAIIQHIRNDYDNLVEFGYAGEEDDILPHPFENDDHVRRMVGFSTITVLLVHKDGISYLGYSGGCDWDPEHGLAATLHKEKIIEYSDNGSGVCSHAAAKDSGNFDFWQQKRTNQAWDKTPTLRLPNPKYNKLKPSEIEENEDYARALIRASKQELFIECFEIGEKSGYLFDKREKERFMDEALSVHNQAIMDYLIQKDETLLQYVSHHTSTREHVEYVLAKGVPILKPNEQGETLLDGMLLRTFHWWKYYLQCAEREEHNNDLANRNYAQSMADKNKLFIQYLLKMGAKSDTIKGHFQNWNTAYNSEKIKKTMMSVFSF